MDSPYFFSWAHSDGKATSTYHGFKGEHKLYMVGAQRRKSSRGQQVQGISLAHFSQPFRFTVFNPWSPKTNIQRSGVVVGQLEASTQAPRPTEDFDAIIDLPRKVIPKILIKFPNSFINGMGSVWQGQVISFQETSNNMIFKFYLILYDLDANFSLGKTVFPCNPCLIPR